MSAVTTCLNCQTENRESAYYCHHCGHRLATNCPRCQAVVPDLFHYCDRCGYALKKGEESRRDSEGLPYRAAPGGAARGRADSQQLMEPGPREAAQPAAHLKRYIPGELLAKLEIARRQGGMVGERRVVTILFCDVNQSTMSAGKVDPEEWTEIINGAFERMIGPVYLYEGTVARLMGDGLLAFFGAPIAHEDDPQRAVLAGLDIISGIAAYRQDVMKKWPIEFDVRVGINTGRVVVGEVGSDMRLEYTAMGDAVNLAARMEQSSEPGTVQVSEATYRLVADDFDVEALGAVQVKGKLEPVPVFRILRSKSRPRRLGIGDTPLVGRREEMQVLEEALDDVSGGFGRIVCLIGEAGLGKSRLVEELHRTWIGRAASNGGAARPGSGGLQPLARWYEATSVSYESALPYGLFRNFFRQILGVSRNDPPAEVERRLAGFVDQLPEERAVATQGVLATLFSLSQSGSGAVEGGKFKNQLFEVVLYLVRTWAGDAPAVMVCDDLHWSDPASVELLLHLFQATDKAPLLLICALRDDRRAPGWQVKVVGESHHSHRYREINLRPLPEEDGDRLVEALLETPDIPAVIRNLIRQRVEGNPLFVEELIRALIDDGAITRDGNGREWALRDQVDIVIPGSLDSLLMSRVDRLDEDSRRILQLAAIMGRSFYYRVLKQICEDDEGLDRILVTLQQGDLIRQVAWQPELEYAFRHTLAQEATYRSILRKRRRELHLRVGLAMEGIFASRLEEHAPVLGHHFAEAGESERALRYFLIAGDVASRQFAHTEAAAHYQRALEFTSVDDNPPQVIDIYLKRGRILELAGRYDKAFRAYERLEELAGEHQNQAMVLASLKAQTIAHSAPTAAFNADTVRRLASRALDVARDLDDQLTSVELLSSLILTHFLAGQAQEGIEYGRQAITEARRLDLKEYLAYALNDIHHCYRFLGMMKEAWQALDEARDLWIHLGNEPMLADNLSGAARLAYAAGDFARAQALSDEAYQLSRRIGNPWGQSYSRLPMVDLLFQQGKIAEAIDTMNECLHLAEEADFIVPSIWVRSKLAALYGYLGQAERGLPLAQEAVEAGRERFIILRSIPQAALAKLLLARGDLEAAGKAIEQGRKTFSMDGLAALLPLVIPLAEAEVDLAQGQPEKAIQVLTELVDKSQQLGLLAVSAETSWLLGRASMDQNDREMAEHHLRRALSASEELGERVIRWQILGALAEIERSGGSEESADEFNRRAREVIDELVANMPDQEAVDSFTRRADVRALYAG